MEEAVLSTVILPVTDGKGDGEKAYLKKAADCIVSGGLVVFPTETVYGLGANALNADAARRIYAAKGRPSDNPLIIHIDDVDKAEFYAHTNALFYRLACAFWPGPLTMILPKRDCIPSSVTGGLDTVAIRLPSDPIANALIRLSGVPIAAPSANISGHPSPTAKEHVISDLSGRVDMILAGNPSVIGLESTVIKVEDDRVILLRPGAVTYEDLISLLGKENVILDRIVTERVTDDIKPLSPGMKYRHYAPNATVLLLHGTDKDILSYMRATANDGTVGYLVYDEDAPHLPRERTLTMGEKNDPVMQAHRLFLCLRAFDEKPQIKTVYARIPKKDGIGLAVYNRLAKAAGFTVINVGEHITSSPRACESGEEAASADGEGTFQIIGLTGTTGAGKGEVAEILKKHSIPVLDTDGVSHTVYERGGACLSELVDAFGEDILSPDGTLNRGVLAALVFEEPDPAKKGKKLSTLNKIAHKHILAHCRTWLDKQKDAGYRAACIDAPQLFESGFDKECDFIIGVVADKETRIARITARDTITREKALSRIAAQYDDAFFAAHCHAVIENNGTLDALAEKLEAVLCTRGLL